MKRITTIFNLPEGIDITLINEYIENALHSEGGNYMPAHPYFQLCRILRLTEITTSESTEKGAEPKAGMGPIVGQRCIVRNSDSSLPTGPFVGVITNVSNYGKHLSVRHPVTKELFFVDTEQHDVELLPP